MYRSGATRQPPSICPGCTGWLNVTRGPLGVSSTSMRTRYQALFIMPNTFLFRARHPSKFWKCNIAVPRDIFGLRIERIVESAHGDLRDAEELPLEEVHSPVAPSPHALVCSIWLLRGIISLDLSVDGSDLIWVGYFGRSPGGTVVCCKFHARNSSASSTIGKTTSSGPSRSAQIRTP